MLELNHQQLIKGVNCSFMRYLHKQVNWNERVIGIFGSVGVGVTTLMLQHIKTTFGNDGRALYLDMDNIWFKSHSLREEVTTFYDTAGTHLFLDDVHLYPDWMEEVAWLYYNCPKLFITFSVSALYKEEDVLKQIGCRLSCYRLRTMSFREFLDYESLMELSPYPLETILSDHASVVESVNSEINTELAFRNYLEHGCYPFYWQDPDAFHFKIQQNIRDMFRRDFPILHKAGKDSTDKIQSLLLLIAESLPTYPFSGALARSAGLSPEQVEFYLDYLKQLELIRIPGIAPSSKTTSYSVHLGNSNLSTALFRENEKPRDVAETFFIDQFSGIARVERKDNNDLLIDRQYSFMIGNHWRDFSRIHADEHTYGAANGLQKSKEKLMPIWALGLFY